MSTLLRTYIAGTLEQCGQFPLFDFSLTPAFPSQVDMFGAHLQRERYARERYQSNNVSSWLYVLRTYA
jgi:hypothetical protein